VLLADLVATSERVAAASRRSEKVALLAELLGRLEPGEVEPAVGFLVGRPRQGRVGIGWATLASITMPPAEQPQLTVGDLDVLVQRVGTTVGAGSVGERQALLAAAMGKATEAEATFIWRIFTGELRQGALEGVMADAIARASRAPADLVRRAAMFSGDLGHTAAVALTEAAPGLERIGLTVLRPVQPMLAGSASDVAGALAETGLASVEWKLDGARIQVHRDGDDVRVYTRNLNDITDRLPRIVDAVRALAPSRLVFDGESIGFHDDGRPRRFQDTMSRFGSGPASLGATAPGTLQLQAFFFDVLHVDGDDLVDAPLRDRIAVLDEIAHGYRLPAVITEDPTEAEAFARGALSAGHEGVMVKALDSPYQAGRRGAAWRKVKPVRTLDLVVLAAEWGHGRRTGWLSNLHLGARGEDGTFVMVGKTFKGLTDELLRWQTERFQEIAIGSEHHVVHVRPELVVEIALDGVQISRRYPGGVALRFARVRRYRPDKSAAEADTIEAVRAFL
jgi:ATP-dependent DNA ligase I